MKVGYGRVSTDSAEQRESAESQRHMLTAAGCDLVLLDVDISGFQLDKRQGSHWDELIELIASGVASEVVVPNWERLGRRVGLCQQLLDAIERAGITVLELDSGRRIDPARDPSDVLMSQFRAAIQENDSRWKSLKVRRGLKAKRARGHLTHAKVPWGFRINNERTAIEPDPALWQTARTLVDHLLDAERAWSLNDALRWLGGICTPPPFKSRSGLSGWLRSPVLRGAVIYGTSSRSGTVRQYEEVIEGQHTPLVTISEQQRLEDRLDQNRRMWGVQAKRTPKPWSGITCCAACGKTLSFKRAHEIRTYYVCTNKACGHFQRYIPVAFVRHAIERSINAHAAAAARALTTPPPSSATDSPEVLRLMERIARYEADIREDGSLTSDLAPLIDRSRRQLLQLQAGDEQGPGLLSFAAAFLGSAWVWSALSTTTYAEVLSRTVEWLDVDLGAAAITDRRPIAIRMKVGAADGTLPPPDSYPTWDPLRKRWETKLDLNDLPPTPATQADLLGQIRDGWAAVMGRA